MGGKALLGSALIVLAAAAPAAALPPAPWSVLTTIDRPGKVVHDIEVAGGLVVWRESSPAQLLVAPATGGTPQVLAPSGVGAFRLATDARGRAVVIWTRDGRGRQLLQMATRRTGAAGFGRGRTIGTLRGRYTLGNVGIGGKHTVLSYTTADGAFVGGTRFRGRGKLRKARLGVGTSAPVVAIAPNGRNAVAWVQGTADGRRELWLRTEGAPMELSHNLGPRTALSLAAGNARVIISWVEQPAGDASLNVARYIGTTRTRFETLDTGGVGDQLSMDAYVDAFGVSWGNGGDGVRVALAAGDSPFVTVPEDIGGTGYIASQVAIGAGRIVVLAASPFTWVARYADPLRSFSGDAYLTRTPGNTAPPALGSAFPAADVDSRGAVFVATVAGSTIEVYGLPPVI